MQIQVTATDALNNPLTYTVANLPAGLSLNATSGMITGTIAASAHTGSPYATTVTASDGTYSNTATFTWTVNPVVTVTTVSNQDNKEGDPVSVQVSAMDAKNNTLTYTATGLPAGLSVNNSGLITGTINPGDHTNSPFNTTVTASDGTYNNSVTFTWIVNPVVAITANSNQTVIEGQNVSLQVTATDALPNKTLTYSAASLPHGLMINSSSGLISGTIAVGDHTTSPIITTVTVTDQTYSNTEMFVWTINA